MRTQEIRGHHYFHLHAIDWLRERMGIHTAAVPIELVADREDPSLARVHGYEVPGGSRDVCGYAGVLTMIVAACVALVASRPDAPTRASVVIVAALAAIAAACLVVVIDALHAYRRRHEVEIVVQAQDDPTAVVEPSHIERWCAEARAALWVVSEGGFTPEALEIAARHAVRCFIRGCTSLEEVRR